MKLSQLNQFNPDYDEELLEKLRLLYKGGFCIVKKENAAKFIPKLPDERMQDYMHRLTHASYVPYFSVLLDYLVGGLLEDNITVAPKEGDPPDPDYYDKLSVDVDRGELPFQGLIREACIEALMTKRAWVQVDLPKRDESVAVASRADEDEFGFRRAYAFLVDAEQVIDWGLDQTGTVKWVVIRRYVCERNDPLESRDTWKWVFTVWRQTAVGPERGVWETKEFKLHEQPKEENEDLLQVEPMTIQEAFDRIPLVMLEVTDGLWAGNKMGPLAQEHFRRKSELSGSISTSLVPIPVAFLKGEIPGVGDSFGELREDLNRADHPHVQAAKRGALRLDADDKFEFVEPSGKAHAAAREELTQIRDDLHWSVTAMALNIDSNAASMSRSGVSKREDKSATRIVLTALASIARPFAVSIYERISQCRGEDVEWEARGLTRFAIAEDELVSVEEATEVMGLELPSPKFRAEYSKRVARSLLPDADAAVLDEIGTEIDDHTEANGHELPRSDTPRTGVDPLGAAANRGASGRGAPRGTPPGNAGRTALA